MSSNKEIRYRILKTLYTHFHENPASMGIGRTTMLEVLNVPENLMDANMLYLKQKRLVNTSGMRIAFIWKSVKITDSGIDVIENKEKYKDQFPFMQVQIVQGNNYGNIAQAGAESQINITQINEAFQKARDETKTVTGIPDELKKQVEDNLTTLEDEIKKDEPELGKVQKIWKWLKGNAAWVVPILKDIILEGMKKGI